MKDRIRFGIMCNGTIFPRWQAEAIQKVIDIPGVVPGLLIINDKKVLPLSFLIAYFFDLGKLFWKIYSVFIRIKLKSSQKIDLSEVLKDVKRVNCETIRKGKYSQYFKESDIESIKAADLDFILRFGFGIIRGDILNLTKYGIWSFHHGDEIKYRGTPPGFWEIYKGDNISAAVLLKLTHKLDAGIVLIKGFLKTQYSYTKNRDQLLLESSRWPAMLCIDILNNNIDKFNRVPSSTYAPIYTLPNNRQFLKFIFKSTYFRLRRLLKLIFYIDYWNIGIVKCHISEFLNDCSPDIQWFPLKSKRIFYADPFALCDSEDSHKLHVFFETYDFLKGKGIIQYSCYNNSFSSPVNVIEDKYHLSYPYLMQNGNEILIIPECFKSESITSYSALKFPHEWGEKHEMIKNYKGVDTAIVKRDNIYWMFTSDKNDGLLFNLNIFYSDKLTGTWIPHPKNPVKTDVRCSRCAGTPFEYKNSLYRPAMDNSERNEGRIVINKVVKLTRTEFDEVPVKTIYPFTGNYFPDKTHTISSSGEYTFIDGAKTVSIISNWRFILYKVNLLIHR